jgi:hypothetical protein
VIFVLAAAVVAAAPVATAPPKVTTATPSTATAKTPATAITPMAERVVALAALNKRNGTTQQFAAHPGDTLHFATLTIRVRACETTPPWEAKQTAAYLQVDDAPAQVRTATAPKTKRVFSGWMFAESPSLNPLQHPLYDVWVKSCTMRFPETGPDTLVVGRAATSQSKAAKSPDAPKAPSSKTL